MKKLLFTLFILFSLIIAAQFSAGGWINDYYVPFLNFTGRSDTISAAQETGTLVYQTSDNKMYLYLPSGWTQIITYGSGSVGNADSLGHRPASEYLVFDNDTFGILLGDTLRTAMMYSDTFRLLGRKNYRLKYPYDQELYIRHTANIQRGVFIPNTSLYTDAYYGFFKTTTTADVESASFSVAISNESDAPGGAIRTYFGDTRDSILWIDYNTENGDSLDCGILLGVFTTTYDSLLYRFRIPNTIVRDTVYIPLDSLTDTLSILGLNEKFIIRDSIYLNSPADTIRIYEFGFNIDYKF